MIKRWLILLSYSTLVFLNGYAFCMISTIPQKAEDYYKRSEFWINFLLQIFFIIYLPVAPFASWLISRSLHHSILISFLFTLSGAWVKFAAGDNYWGAFFGQLLIATVSSVILSSVSTVAETWFPKS